MRLTVLDDVPSFARGLLDDLTAELDGEAQADRLTGPVHRWAGSGGARVALQVVRDSEHWDDLRRLARISSEHRAFRILALVPDDSVAAYRHAFRNAATGVVPWRAAVARIASCTRAAAGGDALVPSEVQQVLSSVVAHDENEPPERLTDEERRAVELLREHQEVQAVAERLHLPRKNVREILDRLKRRVGARSRYDMIAKLGEMGLLRKEHQPG